MDDDVGAGAGPTERGADPMRGSPRRDASGAALG